MIMGIGRDGGMADECMVPESSLVILPNGVSTRDACLVEPLAVAVHGVRRGGIIGNQRVGVIGGGSIGLAAVVAAPAAASSTTVLSTTWSSKLPAQRALWLKPSTDAAVEARSSCWPPTGTAISSSPAWAWE
jgi:threonine dehydrogenase-like Zn-dependent dehydrogenase